MDTVEKNSSSKDTVVFFDKKSLQGPLSLKSRYIQHMSENDPEQPGVVFPNGTINWACPCLGTASIGPCAHLFRAAFKCFHHSEAVMKGSDCIADFERLQECMKQFPKLYKD